MEDFKLKSNYTTSIDDTKPVINTCQDCVFSTYTKNISTNQLLCTKGNVTVDVNGSCNFIVPVV